MLNSFTLNRDTLNGNDVFLTGSGLLISFEQNVLRLGSGTLISFEQNVELLITGSGKLIGIEQNVVVEGSGTCIRFEQKVTNTSDSAFFLRNNYDCDIFIGGYQIPKNKICDNISVSHSEGAAASCTFSLLAASGVQDLNAYRGQSIYVNIRDLTGTYRVFTGFVNVPSLDFIEKKIKFTCTDRREAQINKFPYLLISLIGQYSNEVFGIPKDQKDELEKRLETIPASFDFDNYGNPGLTLWAPKTTADFTLGASQIYYEKPNVTYTDGEKVTNTIHLTVGYRYQRLHQQLVQISWPGYQDFLVDWFNQGTPSFPQKETIRSAANTGSWKPVGNVVYTDLWPAGGFGSVQWQPNEVQHTYVARTTAVPIKDANGVIRVVETFVLDPNGHKIYDIASTTIIDTSSNLARGARWTAARKFSQNLTELYDLKIYSPQAVTKFGEVPAMETVVVNDPFDEQIWANNPSNYAASSATSTCNNAFTDATGYAKGALTITVAASGTGIIKQRSLITFKDDSSAGYYTVTSGDIDVSVGGTLTIQAPGLGSALLPGQHQIVPALAGTVSTDNFYFDNKPNYVKLLTALGVSYDKAKTTLLKAHRNVTVNFRRSIWAPIDLKHTVETTATQVACKGKVSSFTHTIDVQTGEAYTDVTLSLSGSSASDSATPFVLYKPFEDSSYIGTPQTIALGTHNGMDPDPTKNPQAANWNGYIGNKTTYNQLGMPNRTRFTEAFIVDYPPINNLLRYDKTVVQNPPGTNNGAKTNNTGYAAGATSITLAAAGTGSINAGDLVSFAGDTTAGIYIAQNTISDVSSGGVLTIGAGLGSALSAAQHVITTSSTTNQFVINIPNDSLTVTL
jgi:hypothetical protein